MPAAEAAAEAAAAAAIERRVMWKEYARARIDPAGLMRGTRGTHILADARGCGVGADGGGGELLISLAGLLHACANARLKWFLMRIPVQSN